jgi:cyanoexosortase A
MKVTNLYFLTRLIHKSEYWLSGIVIGLIALHVHLLWRLTGNLEQLSLSLVFWIALLSLLWKKRYAIKPQSDPVSSFLGLFIITSVLIRSLVIYQNDEVVFKTLPMISSVGVGLIAVGVKELKQYWRELLIVFLVSLPTTSIGLLLDTQSYFSIATAKFSTVLLWYLGFEVIRQGVYVLLRTGAVEINSFCSGVMPMLTLLQLALLFLLMFPTKLIDKILVLGAAVALAFIVNVVRVALMVILVAFSNHTAFDYWHSGIGSQIFSVISMVAFGWLCQFIIQQEFSSETKQQ